jgi:hypothetical protein
MAIKREALDRLIEQARNDPAFFHGLVFKPEETLAKVDYLERHEKARILELSPEDVIAGLAGGSELECNYTCLDSCGITCDQSGCNYTELEVAPDVAVGRRVGRRSFRPMPDFDSRVFQRSCGISDLKGSFSSPRRIATVQS